MADSKQARVWARRVAAFERSEQTRGAWCAEQGVNANTLDYWRRKLKLGSTALVPIVIEPAARVTPVDRSNAVGGAALVEIALPNGTQIRVLPGTDALWLASLLQSLRTC